MPITSNRSKDNFQQWIQEQIDGKVNATIIALEYVGNQCLREMRENGRYADQTNNLRSSTGWVVVMDGRIVRSSGFAPIVGNTNGGNGNEGANTGKRLARSVAASVTSGKLALVLVAGMNYAVYVESKGLNVMDSAKSLAQKQVPQMIKAIFGQ